MAYVPVPKDLTKVKTKVAFNLTKRQLVCFGSGALIGVPLFFLIRGPAGNSAAALCMMLVNRIVCYDIKELGKQLKKIGMLVVQDQVWNRVTINRAAHKSTRYYREAAKAEQKLEKANINALYQKSLAENPQLASNPLSRWQQKQAIKKEYAAAKRAGQTAGHTAQAAGHTAKTGKAAKSVKEKAEQAGRFVMRHKKGFLIALALFLLVCLLMNTLSSCSMLAQSIGSAVSGSTYPSKDEDMLGTEADYAAKEAELQRTGGAAGGNAAPHPGWQRHPGGRLRREQAADYDYRFGYDLMLTEDNSIEEKLRTSMREEWEDEDYAPCDC